MVWNILLLILYMLQSFVRYAVLNTWPYPFMDWHVAANAIMYVAIPCGFAIVFVLMKGLHRCRDIFKTKSSAASHGA